MLARPWLRALSKVAPSAKSNNHQHQHQHPFELVTPFVGHLLADTDLPKQVTTASAAEMLQLYESMLRIRRMEVAADALYKARLIRGFCHLGIGQEAIPVGVEAALAKNDAIITAYRCHGFALMRGASVHSIIAELLGKATGISRGKGGSMHMFAPNFFGGNGIVGAQVPVGVGVAFAQQYQHRVQGQHDVNCTFALYGDGAANQGQIFESYNMAALWKLPVVFVCENNQYSMGTSVDRSSASRFYYKRGGDFVPGIKVNGMDVLAVREAARYARDFVTCKKGKGPIILEMDTYRYQGHSMSDPGTTYRTRDEIQQIRQSRDTIKLLQSQILAAGMASDEQLLEVEARVKNEVDEAVERAKQDPLPEDSELITDIYTRGTEPSSQVRFCEP